MSYIPQKKEILGATFKNKKQTNEVTCIPFLNCRGAYKLNQALLYANDQLI